MPHFTPHKSSPNSKQLAYAMAFARFYDAEAHNEDLARTMASTIAEAIEKKVLNWRPFLKTLSQNSES